MRFLSSFRGARLAAIAASCSLLGCSAVLGYESDYDDTRGAGGVAGATGGGGQTTVGGQGGAVGKGGGGGSAGSPATGGASGQGQSGTGGQGLGGGSGQAGASGLGGAAAAAGAAGQGGGAAGQGGAAPGMGGTSAAGQGGALLGGAGGGTSGQGGFLSAGNAGTGPAGASGSGGAGDAGSAGAVAGGGGTAGKGGNAGAAGATGGSGGTTGGSAGAGGLPACVVTTAPTQSCGDVATQRDNCGACGLSCGAQGECKAGRCTVDPTTKAPYARQVGYFGLPLAALHTTVSDRLLYRAQVSADADGAVDALYDSSSSDDAPLLKRLGANRIKVGGVDRPVRRWRSARFVSGGTQVLAVASVARIPDEYPQDRALVLLDRASGNVLSTFQLSGDGGAWADTRPPVGGMVPAQDTGDVVALGQKRGVVWDFVEGTTGGAVLRGFPLTLGGAGVFDTAIEPRHAIAASIVSLFDYAYFLSQASMNAPFKLKTIKLEVGAPEVGFGDTSVSFIHPTSMAVVPGTLFVADAGGNPAAATSPNGKLYRYDISTACTKSSPQPVVVADQLQRLIAIAADETFVYTLEVRDAPAGGMPENVVRRRYHDGTGDMTLLVEERPASFLLPNDNPERAERLAKGFVLGESYGKKMLFFGLGSDPAEYREPNDYLLGIPR